MARKVEPKDEAEIIAVFNARPAGKWVDYVAKQTKWDRTTVYRILKREGLITDTTQPPKIDHPKTGDIEETTQNGVVERLESGDTATVKMVSDRLVMTDAEAIDASGYDPLFWVVASKHFKSWTTTIKVKTKDGDAVVTKQNYGWTINLKRLAPKAHEAAHEAIYERVAQVAAGLPIVTPRPRQRPGKPARMLEVDLFDVHFGKLAWAPESGENYDLAISEQVFRHAVQDLLDSVVGQDFERCLFPIGNDFIHIDSTSLATAAGTVVDTDGRLPKIIAAAQMALIYAVDELLRWVDVVDVKFVPGNHDPSTSWNCVKYLEAWYRNEPRVIVDTEPKARKAVEYGSALIGLAHGDGTPARDLPHVFATEFREIWGKTSYAEIHCGHFHKSKRVDFTSVDTFQGSVVRYLHSLSGRDAWHYHKGYVGNRRAAEAFVWDRENGLVTNLFAPVRAA